jgi:hypothetical protein
MVFFLISVNIVLAGEIHDAVKNGAVEKVKGLLEKITRGGECK